MSDTVSIPLFSVSQKDLQIKEPWCSKFKTDYVVSHMKQVYNIYFVVNLGLLVLSDISSTIFYKKTLNLLIDYQGLVAITTIILSLFYSLILCFQQFTFIHIKERKFWVYIISIALTESITNVLQIVGSDMMGKDSGALMTTISQGKILFLFLFSIIFLHTKYNNLSFLGFLLVLLGILLTIIPMIYNIIDFNIGTLLFFCANIPIAVNTLLKQQVLSKYTISVFELLLLKRIFEIPFTIIIYPLYNDFSIHNIFPNLKEGIIYLFNSPKHWGLVILFNTISFIWMILCFIFIRIFDGMLQILGNLVAVPLSTLSFSIPIIMGIDVSKIPLFQIIATVFLTLGSTVYARALLSQ